MKNLLIEQNKKTLILTLNRSEKLNALSIELLTELKKFFMKELPTYSGIRCIILTGAGDRAFCAGGDIKEMENFKPKDAEDLSVLVEQITTQMEDLSIPIIAAVNGVAFGGGLELAMACDFIYASEHAQFGQPEVNLGLIPGFGGCVRLPRYIGRARAREMILTGRPLKAKKALEIGLCSEVFSSNNALMQECLNTADLIASKKSYGIQVAKKVLKQCDPLKEELGLERHGYSDVFSHQDSTDGISHFLNHK